MGPLVAEMLQHREAYTHISQIMAHEEYGSDICKNMVRAMNEEVAPPFHAQMNLEDEGEEGSEQDEYADNADTSDEEGIGAEAGDPAAGSELDVSVEQPGQKVPGPQPPQPLQQMTPAMKNFQRALMSRF
jgi:hypothetical protein